MTPAPMSEGELRAILDGCEGVTPGPWVGMDQLEVAYGLKSWEVRQADFEPANKDFWPERICRSPEGVHRIGPNPNAAHIARLDPNTVTSIITELLALRAPRKEQEAIADEEPDQALMPVTTCGKCGGDLFKRNAKGFWCCVSCGVSYGLADGPYASPNGGREVRDEALAELVHAAFEEGHIKEPWTPGQKAWLESDSKAALESLRAQPHVEGKP